MNGPCVTMQGPGASSFEFKGLASWRRTGRDHALVRKVGVSGLNEGEGV